MFCVEGVAIFVVFNSLLAAGVGCELCLFVFGVIGVVVFVWGCGGVSVVVIIIVVVVVVVTFVCCS